MSHVPAFRGVVVDLDGTLLDSHDYMFAAFRYACSPWGRPPSDAEIYAAFGPDERSILEQLVGAARLRDSYARLQRYYREHVDAVRVHAGLVAVLRDCGAAGVPCGLFTGRGRAATQLLLDAHGLASYFVGIFAGDDGKPKPAPEGVHALAGVMQRPTSELVVVGDSALDMQAAAAAGAAQRLAVWYARGVTRTEHPAPRLQDPNELRPLLGLRGTL